MNIEFHYYAIHALALEAGLDEQTAFIIANSSQEVDASTTPIAYETPSGRVDIACTQNYVFWDESVMNDVYLPFHFLPGDADAAAAARADGRRSIWAVTPNSILAKELLTAAFKEKDPYLMGIALHAFADTWAHQNFCGRLDGWNDMGGGSMASGLPPAGHLQALSSPDEPDAVWTDGRLRPELARIRNADRFAVAAAKVFRYLCVFLGRPFHDDELVAASLRSIWSKPSKDERMADYVIRWNMRPYEPRLWRREAGAPADSAPYGGIQHYDKLAWLKSQLDRSIGRTASRPVRTDSSFYATHLYHWHEAALEHRTRAIAALKRNNP